MLVESASLYVGLFLASAISFAIYGVTAFGYAIVYQMLYQMMALGGIVSGEVSDAVQEIYVCTLTACCAQAFWLRKHWNARFFALCAVAPMLTQPVGLHVLFLMEDESAAGIKRALGGFFFVVGVLQCYIESSKKDSMEAHPFNMLSRLGLLALSMALLCEGFLSGLFNTGGPPLMIFLFYRPMDMWEWRANLAAQGVFLAVQGVSLVSAEGDSMVLTWQERLVLSMGSLFGLSVGNVLAPYISASQFRQALLWLLLVSGVSLLASGDDQIQVFVAVAGILYAILACSATLISAAQKKHTAAIGKLSDAFLSNASAGA